MAQRTLEERVATLEQQVAELRGALQKVAQPQDWRSTVGMFSGDEVMKQIDEAGRKIREADRQRARRQAKRPQPKK